MGFSKSHKWTALALLTLGAPVAAVDAPTAYVWDSGGQMSVGRPAAWGNGVASMSRVITYNGDDVLQITTRNFNEGAIFEFTPPIDLASYKESGYLRLRLRFRDAPATTGVPGGGFGVGAPGSGGSSPGSIAAPQILPPRVNFQFRPRPGGAGGAGGSAAPGGFPGGPPGSSPGGFSGGAPGGEGGVTGLAPGGPPPQTTKIRRLQLTFVLEKGVMSGSIDVPADLEKIKPDDDGWRLFLLAVKDLRATPNAQGQAQRLIVTGDKEDTFYVAQAALVVETGQMSVSIRRPADVRGAQVAELNVKPGLLTLVADVEAGTADPLIEWNFDADNVNPDLHPKPAETPGATPGTEGAPATGTTPGAIGTGTRPGSGVPGVVGIGGGEGGAVAPVVPAGPPVDGRGLVAKFEYPNEEQDYRVEVTVTDRAGKKAPAKASLLIHVRG